MTEPVPTPLSGHLRSLGRNVRSFADPNQVGYLIFYVTNRCNFRCKFCFYGAEIEKGLKPDELTLDEIRKIAESTGPLIQLSMTGGEAFIRSDLEAVTRAWLDNTTPRFVTIPTNASLGDRMERYFTEILPAYPDTYFRLVFSVEGIGEAHDTLRSMPGSFRKIEECYVRMAALRARHPNLTLDSNSVFTAQSEDTLLDTVRYLDANFDFDNISVTFARGDIRNEGYKTNARQKYEAVYEFLRDREKNRESRFLYPVWRAASDVARDNLLRVVFDDEFVSPCVAGRKLVVVSETGEVYPCEILGKSMGKLRDNGYDLKRLLAQHENDEMRKWIKDTKCKCSFECALAASAVWGYSNYPSMVARTIGNIGTRARRPAGAPVKAES